MASSQELANQIQGLTNQYSQFDNNYQGDIQGAVNKAYGGLQPQYNELANAQSDAYNTVSNGLKDYNTQNPQGFQLGQSVDPSSYFNNLISSSNNKLTHANALANTIGQLGGGIQNVVGNLASMYQTQGTNLQNQIAALQPMYQSQLQSEQQAKALAEQQRQFDLGRSDTAVNNAALLKSYNDTQTKADAAAKQEALGQLSGKTLNYSPSAESNLLKLGATKVNPGFDPKDPINSAKNAIMSLKRQVWKLPNGQYTYLVIGGDTAPVTTAAPKTGSVGTRVY